MMLVIGEIGIEVAMIVAIVVAASMATWLIVASIRERRELSRYWQRAEAAGHAPQSVSSRRIPQPKSRPAQAPAQQLRA
jgi:hypothetical protein